MSKCVSGASFLVGGGSVRDGEPLKVGPAFAIQVSEDAGKSKEGYVVPIDINSINMEHRWKLGEM